ncbi:prepilin-type N-terminal cleavage/methylation domain-containing protein [Lachnospiraceae bacterium ASD3451]|uniref:prepilin-type N-terminal cleavage/methylation domain-containing protein n=1 Tax=Diplocloster agilis TaxID=2850323 RepID=UPI001DFFC298|nr:prepilin-type N-terminal cleavage/methylation domain-containing protein [Diplocloster agilis]MBU9745961.1 prepilin-type N-terminal cleavage/methylation domain-containing protein [Diplocloster agilis]
MKLMQKLRNARKDKKGFTLTEMIVVLVIIVILIALLVPTLVGYIDKAKEKSVMAEGKMVLTAAQTVVSEKYGESKKLDGKDVTDTEPGTCSYVVTKADEKGTDNKGEIAKLAEMTENGSAAIDVKNYKVVKIVYTSGGKTATYYAPKEAPTGENEGWTVK